MQTLFRCLHVKDGREMWIEYYLLTEESSPGVEVYGVEVVLRSADRLRPKISRVRGVTPKLSKMISLLQRLADQAVTPDSLRESLSALL